MEMSEGLAKVGIKGAYEGALKFVGNPELISRTHFARFLVEKGITSISLNPDTVLQTTHVILEAEAKLETSEPATPSVRTRSLDTESSLQPVAFSETGVN